MMMATMTPPVMAPPCQGHRVLNNNSNTAAGKIASDGTSNHSNANANAPAATDGLVQALQTLALITDRMPKENGGDAVMGTTDVLHVGHDAVHDVTYVSTHRHADDYDGNDSKTISLDADSDASPLSFREMEADFDVKPPDDKALSFPPAAKRRIFCYDRGDDEDEDEDNTNKPQDAKRSWPCFPSFFPPKQSALKPVTTSTTCALYMEGDEGEDSDDTETEHDSMCWGRALAGSGARAIGDSHDNNNLDADDENEGDDQKLKKEEDDHFIFNHEVFPVHLVDEPEEDLRLSPRILNEAMFHQIVNEAIPRSLRIYKWERIFSISRDGDAFITMLEKCSDYKNTLMVIRTTKGHILGGFASEEWRGQESRQERKTYFGTGTCFLFSNSPESPTGNPESQLNLYPWTGSNDYCQICDADRQYIAMGGGDGHFGLVVKEGFLYGTTGRCATFNNPQLIPGIDGTFDVQDFEVWGMVPLFPSVMKPMKKKYSDVSLLAMDR